MITTTMAYLAAVSVAASLAALLADAGLRRLRLPTRWTWLGAMVLGPVLLGGGALLRSVAWQPQPLPVAMPVTLDLQALVPAGPGAGAESAWRATIDPALGVGWAVASLGLLLFLARAHRRLEREKAAWRARRVRGATVFISHRRGPAVSGTLRGWIVLPEWVLGLPRAEIRLVMLHEGEHLRAGDSRLVLFGLVLASLVPWNPLGWWQLRRLRTAVEVDCDRRVLLRAAEVGPYAAALLSVAAGVSPEPQLAFAAFSENAHTLKTRILAMTAIRSRWTRPAGALLVLLAAAVVVQACGVETPTPTAPVVGQRGAEVAREITDTPSFTAFDVAPQLTNRQDVGRALETFWSETLRPQGQSGKTQVWVRISAEGVVERVSVHESSGSDAVDRGAVEIGRVMRFTPARLQGQAVTVWVSIPITFQSRPTETKGAAAPRSEPRPAEAARVALRPDLQGHEVETAPQSPGMSPQPNAPLGAATIDGLTPPPVSAGGPISETPTFTPFTSAPQLRNREEVGQALESSYPAALRDAGVGGRAEIWVRISVAGEVERVAIQESSGNEALDAAALAVGRVMRFAPATNRGAVVPVWVAIPITFQVR